MIAMDNTYCFLNQVVLFLSRVRVQRRTLMGNESPLPQFCGPVRKKTHHVVRKWCEMYLNKIKHYEI